MKTALPNLEKTKKQRHYYLRAFAKKNGAEFHPSEKIIYGNIVCTKAKRLIREYGYETQLKLAL